MQIHRRQLAEVVPLWFDLAVRFKKDPAIDRAWGWVQEVSSVHPACLRAR